MVGRTKKARPTLREAMALELALSHHAHLLLELSKPGPVVAGIVGTTKLSYDIWGDTVNVASRMESNSQPGCINISEATYALAKDHLDCRSRGSLPVKNRGNVRMYFVDSVHKC